MPTFLIRIICNLCKIVLESRDNTFLQSGLDLIYTSIFFDKEDISLCIRRHLFTINIGDGYVNILISFSHMDSGESALSSGCTYNIIMNCNNEIYIRTNMKTAFFSSILSIWYDERSRVSDLWYLGPGL